eukprot:2006579-Prymnesium_polylepis.1
MVTQHTSASLYCERAIALAAVGQLEASRSDAATAAYLYKNQEDPEVKPWEKPTWTPMTREQKRELRLNQARDPPHTRTRDPPPRALHPRDLPRDLPRGLPRCLLYTSPSPRDAHES